MGSSTYDVTTFFGDFRLPSPPCQQKSLFSSGDDVIYGWPQRDLLCVYNYGTPHLTSSKFNQTMAGPNVCD